MLLLLLLVLLLLLLLEPGISKVGAMLDIRHLCDVKRLKTTTSVQRRFSLKKSTCMRMQAESTAHATSSVNISGTRMQASKQACGKLPFRLSRGKQASMRQASMRQTAKYCGPDTMQRSADQDFIEEMERVDCMKPRDDAHARLSHSQVLPPGVHYEGAQAVRVHCWCEGGEWRGRQETQMLRKRNVFCSFLSFLAKTRWSGGGGR